MYVSRPAGKREGVEELSGLALQLSSLQGIVDVGVQGQTQWHASKCREGSSTHLPTHAPKNEVPDQSHTQFNIAWQDDTIITNIAQLWVYTQHTGTTTVADMPAPFVAAYLVPGS